MNRGREESKNANEIGKSNWTSVIILILHQLNMHKRDLIHGAANTCSFCGNNHKCALMYALYYV